MSRSEPRVVRRAPTQLPNVVAGFDGFVDTILQAVSARHAPDEFTPVATAEEFGRMVAAAGGDGNANIEFVVRRRKLGGNGPIFAYALSQLGVPVTYIGCLGKPEVHPIFEDFARQAQLISIAEPGYTDAVEFQDGKLMLGKVESVARANWEDLTKAVGIKDLIRLVDSAKLLGVMNWTILLNLTDMLNRFETEVVTHLSNRPRTLFVDLADPTKRSDVDLAALLQVLRSLNRSFQVTLGLNAREADRLRRFVEAAGFKIDPSNLAENLRAALGLHCIVIHTRDLVAAASESASEYFDVEAVSQPTIKTGAGDHFNAGFCFGRLIDASLHDSLLLAVEVARHYVRTGESPTRNALSLVGPH